MYVYILRFVNLKITINTEIPNIILNKKIIDRNRIISTPKIKNIIVTKKKRY